MKDEYEVSKLQQDLSKMMDVAYDEHCNRQIAIEALEMVKQPEKDKTFAQG